MKKASRVSIKLGQKIREVRKKRGLSQEDVALEAGLNRAYVGYIERGERNPSVATIDKIAKILKVEIFELFKS